VARSFQELLDPKTPATSSDEAAGLYREALLEVCAKSILVMHKAMAAVTDPQLRADAVEADKHFKAHSHENRIYGRNAPLMVNVPLAQARYVLQLADILLKADYHQDRAANDLRALLQDHLATQSERGFAAQLSGAVSAVTAQAEKALPKIQAPSETPAVSAETAPALALKTELAPAAVSSAGESITQPKKRAPRTKKETKGGATNSPGEGSTTTEEAPGKASLPVATQLGFDEIMDATDAKRLSQYIDEGQVSGRFLVGTRGGLCVAGIMLYPTQIEGHKLEALLGEIAALPGVKQAIIVTMATEPALGVFLRRSKSHSKEVLDKEPATKQLPVSWLVYPKDDLQFYVEYTPQAPKSKESL
jgi:hypothetical protein